MGPEPNIFVFGVGMEYNRNRIGHKARQDLKFSNSFLFFFFFFSAIKRLAVKPFRTFFKKCERTVSDSKTLSWNSPLLAENVS